MQSGWQGCLGSRTKPPGLCYTCTDCRLAEVERRSNEPAAWVQGEVLNCPVWRVLIVSEDHLDGIVGPAYKKVFA